MTLEERQAQMRARTTKPVRLSRRAALRQLGDVINSLPEDDPKRGKLLVRFLTLKGKRRPAKVKQEPWPALAAREAHLESGWNSLTPETRAAWEEWADARMRGEILPTPNERAHAVSAVPPEPPAASSMTHPVKMETLIEAQNAFRDSEAQ